MAVVDLRGGAQREAPVVVFEVVPVEELVAVRDGVREAVEAFREVVPVLVGLERGFAVGVVVRHARSAVAARDAEIGVELRTGRAVCWVPRSAWIVNAVAPTSWVAMVSAMSRSEIAAVSRSVMVQPTA